MAACNSNAYQGRLIPGHTHEDIDEAFAEVTTVHTGSQPATSSKLRWRPLAPTETPSKVRFVHNSSHWMAACNSNAYQGRLIPGHTHEDIDEAFAEVAEYLRHKAVASPEDLKLAFQATFEHRHVPLFLVACCL